MKAIRVGVVTVLVLSAIPVGLSYVTASGGSGWERSSPDVESYDVTVDDDRQRNLTVTTGSILSVYDGDGEVVYADSSYDHYFDVDPVEGTARTVEYIANRKLSEAECPAPVPGPGADVGATRLRNTPGCTANVIERLNITTGETTVLYRQYTDWRKWHDVDRVDEHRFVVADIGRNRVFLVNLTSNLIEWEWQVQNDLPLDSGGEFPREYTHLNDVEVVEGDRVMVNLRNQDMTVFVDMDTGYAEEWTLGSPDDHDTMYEQHNPDYIACEGEEPAVIVADSQNNRIVEYERTGDGGWRRTWVWQDRTIQWPLDADRLPNGNTLLTDTNGGRVLEVDESGEVVWEVQTGGGYDSERLGTGDESSDCRKASTLGLESRSADTDRPARGGDGSLLYQLAKPVGLVVLDALFTVKQMLPGPIVNAVLFLVPNWMGLRELAIIPGQLALLAIWGRYEFRRAGYRLRLPFVKEE